MRIIILSLLFFTNTIYAQIPNNVLSSEEEGSDYLLSLINDYRKKNNLNPLIMDTNLTKGCVHHCDYLSIYDISSHIENNMDSSHLIEILVSPESRIKKYEGKVGGMIAENCVNIGPMVFKDSLHQKYGDIWVDKIKRNEIDYKIAALCVLNYWIESPGHNKNLLKKEATFCGIYQKIYINKKGRYRIASTFLITKRS